VTAMTQRFDETAPEAEIARDIARRGLMVAPVLVAAGAIGWGVDGALSAAYGVGIVVANFLISAAMLTWAGRISVALVMGAAMFGYLVRLGLVAAAVLVVKDMAWVELVPLGLTLIITHLGLLFWETRYVSASLAYPGLKPGVGRASTTKE
jgi:hypothetical protein